jgi:hypothetical protein
MGWVTAPFFLSGNIMSNATEKVAIANIGLLAVGQKFITDAEYAAAGTSSSTPEANKINALFEQVVKELLNEDWFFNRARAELVMVYELTVDTDPTPTTFAAGAVLTGATSLVTATVLEKISDTVYLISEPSGDWTDGEIISDNASVSNSVNCAAGYPLSTEDVNEFGTYDYRYSLPSDFLYTRGLSDYDFDKIKYRSEREGNYLLTNQSEAYLLYNRWIGDAGSTTSSDVTKMPVWFHRLISARLAVIFSPNITENARIQPKAEKEWKEAYLYAKEKNGEEADNEHEGNTDWADGANNEINGL